MMIKRLVKWLLYPRSGWRVRVGAAIIMIVALVIGVGLIRLGVSSWPAFGYLINGGGLALILALVAAIVVVHGYIGGVPKAK
ncbi:MAG: hypothetical protein LKJ69_02780 [Lactobacillus sp.]|jgi:uncharacterized membrane protein|nr:hypothetical protein [Lactobacillus sp.]MCI2032304.1 hypothetical protein [Lactobacillus sp.]